MAGGDGRRDGYAARHASSTPPDHAVVGSQFMLTRRSLLAGSLSLGVALFDVARAADAGRLALGPGTLQLDAGAAPDSVYQLRRPQDMLWLNLELYGVEVVGGALKATGADPAIVLTFQPQSVAEQAIFLDPSVFKDGFFAGYQDLGELLGIVPAPGRVGAVLGGDSRIALSLPQDDQVPFTVEAILDAASRLESRVVDRALPRIDPEYAEIWVWTGDTVLLRVPIQFTGAAAAAPSPTQTAIEAPWHLVLSPSQRGAWAHSRLPVEKSGRTELWHTRLAVRGADGRPDEDDADQRIVRAVWNRGVAVEQGDPFDVMPLTNVDRDDIVRATTTYADLSQNPDDFWPEPVAVDHLNLSALGASLDVRGDWNPNGFPGTDPFNLEQWKHRMTGGRDQFARIVRKGYLFPFGHRVSLVEETERRFVGSPGLHGYEPYIAAYLFKRMYIVVRERVKRYGGALGQAHEGRRLPFRRLRLVTRVTPNLDDRTENHPPYRPFAFVDGAGGDFQPFVPTIADVPYEFAFAGEDWDGHRSEFRAPVAFVFHGDWAYDAGAMRYVFDNYTSALSLSLRTTPFGGQTVALAPRRGAGTGLRAGGAARDAAQVVKELVFASAAAQIASTPPDQLKLRLEASDQPAFFPEMEKATIALTGAKEAAGGTPGLGDLVVEYYDRYFKKGFTKPTSAAKLVSKHANHGEVFAKVIATIGSSVLKFASNRSGGVVTPDLDIVGLSRALGPISGTGDIDEVLKKVASNEFDPTSLFPDTAKLLGALPLGEITAEVLGFVDTAGGIASQALQTVSAIEDEVIERRIVWQPDLKGNGILAVSTKSLLRIEALVRVPLADPTRVEAKTSGELRDVTLQILEDPRFVNIEIRRLAFTQKGTAKPKIDIDIGDVTFGAALEFVKQLADFMSSRDKPWWIDVTGSGVETGFALEVPTIAVGIFALSNIAFTGSLVIPFNGDAVQFCFEFARREDPFRVSVGIFGGGGFFGICITGEGIRSLEASFEFGASVAIDLGVASGGASLMGGIYYKNDGAGAVLEGFFRISGHLSILHLVSVSVELYMGLTHDTDGNKVVGEAKVKVKITIGFFSISPTVEARRTFSEDASDPPFGDQMSQEDWAQYCAAFAPAS